MPTFKITDPSTGKSVRITGDSAPSPEDIDYIFSTLPKEAPQPQGPGLKAAMFPRTAKAVENGVGYGKQVVGAGLDMLSLPGRAVASVFDKDRGYNQSLADTEGGNFVSKTVRDPGTAASLIAGPFAAPIAGAIRGGTLLAAPVAGAVRGGTLLANLAKLGIVGAGEGAGSAAAHQADNAISGKEISAKDAAAETALSAIMPAGMAAAGRGASSLLKASGKKILESVIKPAKKFTQGQGSKFDVQNIFDANLDSMRGLKGLDENISAYHDALNEKYGEALSKIKGGSFNAGQALKQAIGKAQARIEKGGLTPDEEAGIKHGIETWADYLANSDFIKSLEKPKATHNMSLKAKQSESMRNAVDLMNGKETETALSLPAGAMPPSAGIAIRKAVQKASKFDRTDPKAVKGAELFAQDLQASMNEQLSTKFKDLRKLDAEFAKLHPVERATEDAVNRTAKNYGISLMDLGGLGVLGLGAGTGDKHTSLSGLALLAATHGARSPGLASALYRAGAGAESAAGKKIQSALAKIAARSVAQKYNRSENN